jgi:hypothetical protein
VWAVGAWVCVAPVCVVYLWVWACVGVCAPAAAAQQAAEVGRPGGTSAGFACLAPLDSCWAASKLGAWSKTLLHLA